MHEHCDVRALSDAKLASRLTEVGDEDARSEAAVRLHRKHETVSENVLDDVDSLEAEAKAIQFCRVVQELGAMPESDLWFTTPESVKRRYRAQAKAARKARAWVPGKPE